MTETVTVSSLPVHRQEDCPHRDVLLVSDKFPSVHSVLSAPSRRNSGVVDRKISVRQVSI